MNAHLSKNGGGWILLASLLVNCFLLGLLVAPVFHPHRSPPFMRPPGDMAESLSRGLSPADAAIIREAFQKAGPVFNESRMNTDKAMLKMIGVLQQPSVDPKDLQNALGEIASEHAKLDDAMNGLISTAATGLSSEGRQKFATSILPPSGMHMPPPGMPMPPPDRTNGDWHHHDEGIPPAE